MQQRQHQCETSANEIYLVISYAEPEKAPRCPSKVCPILRAAVRGKQPPGRDETVMDGELRHGQIA